MLTRLIRLTALVAVLGSLSMLGCGRKPRAARHGGESAAPAPVPPTPDTTPVEALRTPAGLVLKTDQAPPAAPTATPSLSPPSQ